MSDSDFLAYRFPGESEIQLLSGRFQKIQVREYVPESGDFVVRPFDGEHIHILKNGKTADWSDFQVQGFLPASVPNDKATHLESVQRAIQQIQLGSIEKVVLSRTDTTMVEESPDLKSKFLRLEEVYPKAFICLLVSNRMGCWLGASPEPLIDQFEIAALAGSIELGASWSEKEITEHQLVSDYISSHLKSSGIVYEASEILEKPMGHIKHLYRKFRLPGSLKLMEQMQLAEALHPTPAVCGIPLQQTRALIHQLENYRRELYTGYWGKVEDSQLRLYVNLRLCSLGKNAITFYAGGGINVLSDPEKEWEETNHKIALLKKYIL